MLPYLMGSWIADMIDSKDSKIAGKVVAKKIPIIDGGKGTGDEFLGGVIDGLCVSSNTKVKDEAIRVCKYLAEGTANAYGGLTTWKGSAEPVSILTPLNKQIYNIAKDAKGYVLAWDTLIMGTDAETHKNLVAQIFGGEISPEDFAKKMQKLNE
jgi:raffinose/stachyose/melibiose transport system substrate-binding protein